MATMKEVVLDTVALEQLQEEQKALLDAVDSMRKHGVGQFVDLPQIIVVGDQSSGKSSVLEAISRVRFPIKDGLCTRFATELVLRTKPTTRVDVQVQSTSSTSATPAFNESRFNKEELPSIIDKARGAILKNGSGFSEDVLRIEVSGPDIPHLTLVDLPGFYHSEDDNQSAEGRKVVDRLAERYMKNTNSIILAVVSARNQVILQTVLRRIKECDPNRARTLGIITKPDLLTPQSQDELSFVKLAKNQENAHQLLLGWHVLRNRGEGEDALSDKERDSKEESFLESSIWSTLSSQNRGIGSLRKKLSSILLDHIRQSLPTLIENIQAELNDRQSRLHHLGEPRNTPGELRAYLGRIATRFQSLSKDALGGNYNDKFFGGLYPEDGDEQLLISDSRVKKLRALMRDLNRAFAVVLSTKGSRRFILHNGSTDQASHVEGLTRVIEPGNVLQDLVNIYKFESPVVVSRSTVIHELEVLSSYNQGVEFPGSSNDKLAVDLFKDQSSPWEPVAKFHIGLVLEITQSFVDILINDIAGDGNKTAKSIMEEIALPFFENKTKILGSKLQELLLHYRDGFPQPLDTEFRSLLAKRGGKALQNEIIRNLLRDRPNLFTDEAISELGQQVGSSASTELGVEGLIDKMEVYYEVSLRTFTENVIILAIENCLLRDIPQIFSPDMVYEMKDEKLSRLAVESNDIKDERARLQNEHNSLKAGLKLCSGFRSRKTRGVSTASREQHSALSSTPMTTGTSPIPKSRVEVKPTHQVSNGATLHAENNEPNTREDSLKKKIRVNLPKPSAPKSDTKDGEKSVNPGASSLSAARPAQQTPNDAVFGNNSVLNQGATVPPKKATPFDFNRNQSGPSPFAMLAALNEAKPASSNTFFGSTTETDVSSKLGSTAKYTPVRENQNFPTATTFGESVKGSGGGLLGTDVTPASRNPFSVMSTGTSGGDAKPSIGNTFSGFGMATGLSKDLGSQPSKFVFGTPVAKSPLGKFNGDSAFSSIGAGQKPLPTGTNQN